MQVQRIQYRLWQLWRAVTGRVSVAEARFVANQLTVAEQPLFARLPRYDQRHALDVVQLLRHEGTTTPALIGMALLHDIGKVSDTGRPLGLAWYGVIVLTQRLLPAVYTWLLARYEPVQRHAQHEQRSVTMARVAGARVDVCMLLQDVADGVDSPLVRLFAEADDRC
jgi:hypothetical protein